MPPNCPFVYPPGRQTVRDPLGMQKSPEQGPEQHLVSLCVLGRQDGNDVLALDVIPIVDLKAGHPLVKPFFSSRHLLSLDQTSNRLVPLLKIQQVLKKYFEEV